MGDTLNQAKENNQNLNMNGAEPNIGLEAEDIVADAIKLNVDEDLNEQRYDNNLSKKSANFENVNGNQSLNIEDEPNYEIDENDDEDELINEHGDRELRNENDEQNDNPEKNEENSLTDDHDLKTQTTNNDETSKKNKNEETNDNSTVDKKSSGKDDKTQDNSKSNQNKKDSTQNDEKSNKDNKKDENASESDSKAAKSKSSSSKEKDGDKSNDRKSSSNDKIVWVSGLSSNVKATDLQNLFKKYGKVVSAKLITNTKLPGSKIFGVITMESVEIVEKCIQKLNKTEFEGKTITVEKNRLEDKKSTDAKEDSKKDNKTSSKDKRDRSKSPRRRSFSPIRRFPLPHHRPSFPSRRGHPPFGFRGRGGRGGFGPRLPFMHGPPPGLIRKIEAERMFRNREIRAKERRRAEENYRRQKELERRQQEEREKLEREKLKIKIERERLEREKADFLRVEREKARLERERIEREREDLRRKQIQLPDSRSRSNLTPNKRFDDFAPSSANWDFDRKLRFTSSTGAPLTTRYDDLDNGLDSRNNLTNFSYNLLSTTDLIDRRKLDPGLASTRDTYDMKAPSRLSDIRSSGGYDRGDDRRQSTNGSRRNERDDWKRTDNRFLDKNLSQSASQSSYLSSTTRASSTYDRTPDAWSSAPDRMPPASSLTKFSSYAQVSGLADRARVPSLTPNVMGSAIGMYNQTSSSSNMPISGMLSNPNYNSNLSGSGHRRY